MAFDKCKFSTLFQKIIDRKVPPIIVRVLIFLYEQQKGFVKLAGVFSASFSITNGTRQGSVLSPALFACYLDDLLKKLRQKGLGCHVAGKWMGAAGYADDLVLLAPSRGSMSKMLEVCEEYALEHNLAFSTDVNPTKSKSKCIFMCGKTGNVLPEKIPRKLFLNKKELPFVASATHLGHELHQSCQMAYDSRIKRAQFIDCSIEIKDIFAFALPEQVMKAVSLYALHCYGAMLWKFSDDNTGQFCRAFSTCAKIVYI